MNEDKNNPHQDDEIVESPLVANDIPEANPALELEAAKAEIAKLKDQALRALAEAENTRRRAQRDREEAQRYGIAQFAREMLSVADNLERALAAIPAESLEQDPTLKTLYEGVQATERQLDSTLSKQQIKKIVPLGEKFDSHFHQAMFEIPTNDHPQGHIVQVLQAGYVLHDRLLRPAMVAVAKNTNGTSDIHVDTKA